MEKLNATLQENILTLLAYSDEQGRIIARRLQPELCDGDYRVIAERLLDYWRRYDSAPGASHTGDLFTDITGDKHNRKAGTFKRIVAMMGQLYAAGINERYVMDNLDRHARVALFSDRILKAAEAIHSKQADNLEQVERLVADMLHTRAENFSPGMKLSDIERMVDYLEFRASEFVTGVEPLDQREICPARGKAFMLLAPTGYGKTWGLIHIGKQAVILRKRVAHVSLEMDEEEVMQRYWQTFFSLTKRDPEAEVHHFIFDEDEEELVDFETEVIKPDFTFQSPDLAVEMERHVIEYQKLMPWLRVKAFPTSSLTVDKLEAYLDNLEVAEKFIPDMVILDYPKLMKTDAKNLRVSLGRMYEELRGMAKRRNFALVTAAQGNRASLQAQTVRGVHTGEDISLMQSSDVAVTYSQTSGEKNFGWARLYVEKARAEEDKFAVLISQSYALGQFCLEAYRLPKNYWDQLSDLTGQTEEEDDGEEGDEDD